MSATLDRELAEMLGLSDPGTPSQEINSRPGGGGTAPLSRSAGMDQPTYAHNFPKSDQAINSNSPGIQKNLIPGKLIPGTEKINSQTDLSELQKLEEELLGSGKNSKNAKLIPDSSLPAPGSRVRKYVAPPEKKHKVNGYVPVKSKRLREIDAKLVQRQTGGMTPEQQTQFAANLNSKEWRLENLYVIKLDDGTAEPFVMRHEQREFMRNRKKRNFVPKARKLGMSTFIVLDALDECLFPPKDDKGNAKKIQCGIIDLKETDAWAKLAIARFAVVNGQKHPTRPEIAWLWSQMMVVNPLVKDSNGMMEWKNGCIFEAGTNYTGKTPQRLHISEYGPISDEQPDAAKRIKQGSMNSVVKEGIIDIETTMQGGRLTECYAIFEEALRNISVPEEELTDMHWKLHYFSWLRHPGYCLPGRKPTDAETMEYFAKLTAEYKDEFIRLYGFENGVVPLERQAWYEMQKRTMRDLMYQQFPTVLAEVDRVSLTGQIYPEMLRVRQEGRIKKFNPIKGVPLFITTDIGSSDNAAYWLWQHSNGVDYFLDCCFGVGKGAPALATKYREWQLMFPDNVIDQIFLPHDGATDDRGSGLTYQQNLENCAVPGRIIEVVPMTRDVWGGIDLVRAVLVNAVFHERCDQKLDDPDDNQKKLPSGVGRMEGYRRSHTSKDGKINNSPHGDICSHAADAIRNGAEAAFHGLIKSRMRSLVPGMVRKFNSRWETEEFVSMVTLPSWEKQPGGQPEVILA